MRHYTPLKHLPPPRAQVETIKILKQLAKAAEALGELRGMARTIPNQTMLINAIVLKEAKDSSEIENIITTQDELYQALTIQSKMNPQIKEVINYRKAIFEGFETIQKFGIIRLKDLISLQSTIIENNAGIRKIPGTVLKNDRTGEVVYTPPQDRAEIMDLLDNFLAHFNINEAGFHPLINLAILHYQFESIHPFYDGNGRTGRILNILYLIMNQLIDIPILYLSSYIIEHKGAYYQLLNQVNKKDDWESWILFMLQAVEVTSQHTIQKIKLIRADLENTLQIIANKRPKIHKKELVELLYEQPYCKIEFVISRLSVERKTASRYLNELVDIGILAVKKIGRKNIYINTSLLDILKKY